MSDSINFGSRGGSDTASGPSRKLLPMRVGEATVYVEQPSQPAETIDGEEIYGVSGGREEAFDQASNILQETVRVLGQRIEDLASTVKPDQVTVEFGLSFEATIGAQLIPVLFRGETKAGSELRVTAVWNIRQE